MTTKPQRDVRRTQLLRALHAMARELALSEDSRRDLVEQITGARSTKGLPAEAIARVCDRMRDLGAGRGSRLSRRAAARSGGDVSSPVLPQGEPWVKKARALWLSLWHLGELSDASEAALRAFGARQTGIDALTWIAPEQATAIVEALKSWCGRAGFDPPATDRDAGHAAKVALCEALWRRLHDLGAVRVHDLAALDRWVSQRQSTHHTSVRLLDPSALDRCADALGRWLRATMERRDIDPPLSAWRRPDGDR